MEGLGTGDLEGAHACLHVTLKGSTFDSALSGSPDILHTPPDGIGLNTTLQANCEPVGCHVIFIIIIITDIIHSIIN